MILRRPLVLLLTTSLAASPLLLAPLRSAHAQETQAEQEAEQEAEEAHAKAEARNAAKRAAPPSALPGAEAQEQESGHANVDLNPNDALFDAINRGSLNAAKEALNRGADMRARNVLDQTPLDMAIDLNRNDITFLLLSMRTYNPEGSMVATTEHKEVDADKKGNGHLAIKATVKQPALALASKYDASGGRPIPEIGFLGFSGK
ncbi:ankyrin repeat domain-containing protein [Acidomonas methanolica]|uniref:ankyrin repeat domain-containing protein n=1 Tax=Acidomonas methanolica TaxID=437 RepID=UPI002119DC37|nr:ankyrin repeat domain-containing protein [Acidomonas methanolica]MCQ9155286.1 ankyrin repeat domain-containing protein [Acidomonas methanolica]